MPRPRILSSYNHRGRNVLNKEEDSSEVKMEITKITSEEPDCEIIMIQEEEEEKEAEENSNAAKVPAAVEVRQENMVELSDTEKLTRRVPTETKEAVNALCQNSSLSLHLVANSPARVAQSVATSPANVVQLIPDSSTKIFQLVPNSSNGSLQLVTNSSNGVARSAKKSSKKLAHLAPNSSNNGLQLVPNSTTRVVQWVSALNPFKRVAHLVPNSCTKVAQLTPKSSKRVSRLAPKSSTIAAQLVPSTATRVAQFVPSSSARVVQLVPNSFENLPQFVHDAPTGVAQLVHNPQTGVTQLVSNSHGKLAQLSHSAPTRVTHLVTNSLGNVAQLVNNCSPIVAQLLPDSFGNVAQFVHSAPTKVTQPVPKAKVAQLVPNSSGNVTQFVHSAPTKVTQSVPKAKVAQLVPNSSGNVAQFVHSAPTKVTQSVPKAKIAQLVPNSSGNVAQFVHSVPTKVTQPVPKVKVAQLVPNSSGNVAQFVHSVPIKVTQPVPKAKVAQLIPNSSEILTKLVTQSFGNVAQFVHSAPTKVTQPVSKAKVAQLVPNSSEILAQLVTQSFGNVAQSIHNAPTKVTQLVPNSTAEVAQSVPNSLSKVTQLVPNSSETLTSQLENKPRNDLNVVTILPVSSAAAKLVENPTPCIPETTRNLEEMTRVREVVGVQRPSNPPQSNSPQNIASLPRNVAEQIAEAKRVRDMRKKVFQKSFVNSTIQSQKKITEIHHVPWSEEKSEVEEFFAESQKTLIPVSRETNADPFGIAKRALSLAKKAAAKGPQARVKLVDVRKLMNESGSTSGKQTKQIDTTEEGNASDAIYKKKKTTKATRTSKSVTISRRKNARLAARKSLAKPKLSALVRRQVRLTKGLAGLDHPGRGKWRAQCIICSERFTDKYEFHRHATLSHPGVRIVFCEMCSSSFRTDDELREHRSSYHKITVMDNVEGNATRIETPSSELPDEPIIDKAETEISRPAKRTRIKKSGQRRGGKRKNSKNDGRSTYEPVAGISRLSDNYRDRLMKKKVASSSLRVRNWKKLSQSDANSGMPKRGRPRTHNRANKARYNYIDADVVGHDAVTTRRKYKTAEVKKLVVLLTRLEGPVLEKYLNKLATSPVTNFSSVRPKDRRNLLEDNRQSGKARSVSRYKRSAGKFASENSRRVRKNKGAKQREQENWTISHDSTTAGSSRTDEGVDTGQRTVENRQKPKKSIYSESDETGDDDNSNIHSDDEEEEARRNGISMRKSRDLEGSMFRKDLLDVPSRIPSIDMDETDRVAEIVREQRVIRKLISRSSASSHATFENNRDRKDSHPEMRTTDKADTESSYSPVRKISIYTSSDESPSSERTKTALSPAMSNSSRLSNDVGPLSEYSAFEKSQHLRSERSYSSTSDERLLNERLNFQQSRSSRTNSPGSSTSDKRSPIQLVEANNSRQSPRESLADEDSSSDAESLENYDSDSETAKKSDKTAVEDKQVEETSKDEDKRLTEESDNEDEQSREKTGDEDKQLKENFNVEDIQPTSKTDGEEKQLTEKTDDEEKQLTEKTDGEEKQLTEKTDGEEKKPTTTMSIEKNDGEEKQQKETIDGEDEQRKEKVNGEDKQQKEKTDGEKKQQKEKTNEEGKRSEEKSNGEDKQPEERTNGEDRWTEERSDGEDERSIEKGNSEDERSNKKSDDQDEKSNEETDDEGKREEEKSNETERSREKSNVGEKVNSEENQPKEKANDGDKEPKEKTYDEDEHSNEKSNGENEKQSRGQSNGNEKKQSTDENKSKHEEQSRGSNKDEPKELEENKDESSRESTPKRPYDGAARKTYSTGKKRSRVKANNEITKFHDTCRVCEELFTLMRKTKKRIADTKTEGKPIKCPLCQRYFTSIFHLELHIRTNHLRCQRKEPCKKLHEDAEIDCNTELAIDRSKCTIRFNMKTVLNDREVAQHKSLSLLKESLSKESPDYLKDLSISFFEAIARGNVTARRNSEGSDQRANVKRKSDSFTSEVDKNKTTNLLTLNCSLCDSKFLKTTEYVRHVREQHGTFERSSFLGRKENSPKRLDDGETSCSLRKQVSALDVSSTLNEDKILASHLDPIDQMTADREYLLKQLLSDDEDDKISRKNGKNIEEMMRGNIPESLDNTVVDDPSKIHACGVCQKTFGRAQDLSNHGQRHLWNDISKSTFESVESEGERKSTRRQELFADLSPDEMENTEDFSRTTIDQVVGTNEVNAGVEQSEDDSDDVAFATDGAWKKVVIGSKRRTTLAPLTKSPKVSRIEEKIVKTREKKKLKRPSRYKRFHSPEQEQSRNDKNYTMKELLETEKGLADETNDKLPIACDKCNRHFANRALLNEHLFFLHDDSLKDTVLTDILSPKSALKSDYERETQQHWRCETCIQNFKLFQGYGRHRYFVHHDDSMVHVCENCSKVMTNVTMVNVHICLDAASYECRTCNETFSTGMSLRLHNMDKHIETEGPHVCEPCEKTFLTRAMLERHKKGNHRFIQPYSNFNKSSVGIVTSGISNDEDLQSILSGKLNDDDESEELDSGCDRNADKEMDSAMKIARPVQVRRGRWRACRNKKITRDDSLVNRKPARRAAYRPPGKRRRGRPRKYPLSEEESPYEASQDEEEEEDEYEVGSSNVWRESTLYVDENEIHQCSLCQLYCLSRPALRNHMANIHSTTDEICELCQKVYPTGKLIRHMIHNHVSSDECNGRRLEASWQIGTNSNEIDTEIFIRMLGIRRLVSLCEYRRYAEDKNSNCYPCTFCEKISPSYELYRYHYLLNHDAMCVLCNIEFKTGPNAARHKSEVHGSGGRYIWFADRTVMALTSTKNFTDVTESTFIEMLTSNETGDDASEDSDDFPLDETHAGMENLHCTEITMCDTGGENVGTIMNEAETRHDDEMDLSYCDTLTEEIVETSANEGVTRVIENPSFTEETSGTFANEEETTLLEGADFVEETVETIANEGETTPIEDSTLSEEIAGTIANEEERVLVEDSNMADETAPTVTNETKTRHDADTSTSFENVTRTVSEEETMVDDDSILSDDFAEPEDVNMIIVVTNEDLKRFDIATRHPNIWGLAAKISSTFDEITPKQVKEMLECYFERQEDFET